MKAQKELLNLPVIRQMQDLTTNPVCTKTQGRVDEVRYETADKVFVACAKKKGLPRPTDVPVFMFALEALQKQQDIARDIAEKTGVDFDPRLHMTINITTDEILVALDRNIQTNARKAVIKSLDRYSDTTIEIKYLGDAKKARRKNKKPLRYKFAMIAIAEYGNTSVDVSFTETYLNVLNGLDNKEIRYLALDHVVRLTGTASQLYSILAEQLGHARANNEYRIAARTLARKIFGEERGGDKEKLPTSRFYAPYITNALAEIAEKTGWVIGSEKIGRGEDVKVTFWTAEIRRDNIEKSEDRVPNAFEVAKAAKKQRDKTQVSEPKKRETTVVGDNSTTSPALAPTPVQAPATLSESVSSTIPAENRNDKSIISKIAQLITDRNEADAITVIEYVKKNQKHGFAKFLTYLANSKGLATVADEERGDSLTDSLRKCYKRAIQTKEFIGEDAFLERCKEYSIDPATVLAWDEARQAK
ncbi:MAG: RepB family plasmid replication initiator protein [Pseudodesulfovibrio sp.]|nr:RepB family plasmid replication initiator protein [Pseudodesulfovibrio sp.]